MTEFNKRRTDCNEPGTIREIVSSVQRSIESVFDFAPEGELPRVTVSAKPTEEKVLVCSRFQETGEYKSILLRLEALEKKNNDLNAALANHVIFSENNLQSLRAMFLGKIVKLGLLTLVEGLIVLTAIILTKVL